MSVSRGVIAATLVFSGLPSVDELLVDCGWIGSDGAAKEVRNRGEGGPEGFAHLQTEFAEVSTY